jgi:hypothetical protein
MLVDATSFNSAANHPRPVLMSRKTCTGAFTWSGTASFVSGTGRYKGIHGTLKLKGTFAGISPRFKSGKHKGQCEPGQKVRPVALYLSITGTGKVSFS